MKPSLTVVANINVNELGPFGPKFSINEHAEAVKISLAKPTRSVFVYTNRQVGRLGVLLFLVCPIQSFAQTVIAVARNPEEVVLSADSRGIDIRTSARSLVCKIRHVGEFWIAVAGHTNTKAGSAPRIDVWASLDEGIRSNGTQRDKVEAFVAIFEPQLKKMMNEMQVVSRVDYEKTTGITSLIFAAVDKGVPVFFIRDFVKNTAVTSMVDPVDIVRIDTTNVLTLGQVQVDCRGVCGNCGSCDARIFIQKRGTTGIDLKPTDLAHFIVAYGALMSPQTVGPPIEILRITKNGQVKWVQRETCKDAEEKPKPKGRRKRS